MALDQKDLDFMARYMLPLLQLRVAIRAALVAPGPPDPKYTSLATQLDVEILAALNRMPSLP
jgi:hypothetical protein